MNMSPLVHLPPDSMSEQIYRGPASYPVAAPIERKWAGVACLVAFAVTVVLVALAG